MDNFYDDYFNINNDLFENESNVNFITPEIRAFCTINPDQCEGKDPAQMSISRDPNTNRMHMSYGGTVQQPFMDPIDIVTGAGGIVKGTVSGAMRGIGNNIISKSVPSIGSRIAGASVGATKSTVATAAEESGANAVSNIWDDIAH